MLLARRLVPFLIIPLLVFLESAGWYAFRTLQWPYLSDVIGGFDTVSALVAAFTLVTALGAVVAGLVGLGVGPWGVLPLGLLLAAVGVGTLPLAPPGLELVPVLIGGLGAGAVRASVWGLAVVELAAPRENLRTALLVLLYGAVNAGAVLGPMAANPIRDALGYGPLFFGAAGVIGVAALLSVVPVILVFVDKEPRSQGDRARHLHLPSLASSGVLILVLAPAVALLYQGSSALWRFAWDLDLDLDAAWLASLNPLVILMAAPVVAAVLVAVHFGLRRSVPALILAGPGLILSALGLLLGLVGSGSFAMLALAMGVIALGEVLSTPTIFSRFLGDLHWRALTLAAAAWVAIQSVLWWGVDGLSSLLHLDSLELVVGWLAVGLAMVLGIALTIAAIPLQRHVYATEEPALTS